MNYELIATVSNNKSMYNINIRSNTPYCPNGSCKIKNGIMIILY